MAASIIMFAFMTFCSVMVFPMCLGASKANKNVLLGVSLPIDVMNDPRIEAVKKSYKKGVTTLALSSCILASIVFFLYKWQSLQLMFMFTWFVLYAYFIDMKPLLARATCKKMMRLKQENKWYVGSTDMIYVDTALSKAKKQFPLSFWWYILPLAIVVASAVFVRRSTIGLSLSILSIFFVAIAGWFSYSITHRKSHVFSEKSEVNIAIQRIYVSLWSKTCFFISLCSSSMIALLCFYIVGVLSMYIVFGLITLISIIILLAVMMNNKKIRASQTELLTLDNMPLCIDKDYYWSDGYYCNPADKHLMIEARWCIGSTMNFGRPAVKVLLWGLLILFVAILAPAFIDMFRTDFGINLF